MSRYKRSYRNYSSTAKKANLALAIAKTLASQHKVEYKVKDVKDSGANMLNTGTVVHLLPVAQGTDQDDRIGNEIELASIQMKFRIAINSAATTTFCRVLLVKDFDNQGATPSINDILGTGTDYSDYLTCSFKHVDNKHRFSFLYDKTFTLGINAIGGIHQEYYKKVPLKIEYTSANSADMTNQQVFLVFLSNESTNYPTIRYFVRSKYTDD